MASKPRYWSERRAWLHLAKAWREAADWDFFAIVECRVCVGICASIDALFHAWKIGHKILWSMKARLPKPLWLSGYCWKCFTRRGSLARARFCERMAAKLEKKRTVAK